MLGMRGVMHDMARLAAAYYLAGRRRAWMGELHDKPPAVGGSAVSLGWWLEGEDEGGNEGDHHFATVVITGIAVG